VRTVRESNYIPTPHSAYILDGKVSEDSDGRVRTSGISGRDKRGLSAALNCAKDSPHLKYRMGAVAIKGGRVLGASHNRPRNTPQVAGDNNWQECSEHAEQALVRMRDDLQGAVVYVARLDARGNSTLARPCIRCYEGLVKAGARRVVWTGRGGSVGVETLLGP
jgi:tRNA(Arg) A34 adenosine deaminase TadA